jgi:lipopolysaccharide transport system ATP-binding protein
VPAVLEFAELEGFAEAPVRTYSEGMKLRLAFGVVAQLEPSALLVDEVISVGDLRFQRRCLDRIRELREAGTSLLLASHALEQVEAECDRAVWLQAGSVRAIGDAPAVVASYREAMASATLDRTPGPGPDDSGPLELRRNRFGSQELTIEGVLLQGTDREEIAELRSGAPLTLSLRLSPADGPVADPIVGVTIHRAEDGVVCYDANTEADRVKLGTVSRERLVELSFDRLDLLPGDYVLDAGVYRPDWEYAYDFHWQAYPLRVVGRRGDRGVFRPPHGWRVRG